MSLKKPYQVFNFQTSQVFEITNTENTDLSEQFD